MGWQAFKKQNITLVRILSRNKKTINKKCYKNIKETGLFQHCSKIDFPEEICDDGPFCQCYNDPKTKWKLGDCPMSDQFLKTTYIAPKKKIRIGQQKHI